MTTADGGAEAGTRATFDPIGAMLEGIRAEHIDDERGEVATYIPELSTADPGSFGLALAGVAGSVYSAGEATVAFTIQSISKPFVYALALADAGADTVAAKVGVEPSGEGFNAISLEPETGRPANPLINAGAIMAASLVRGDDPAARFERIRQTLSRCAGRDLAIDEDVYRSERATGHRNMALAHLMRQAGVLAVEVDDALEVYFRQCSLLVTAVDLAVMAATLANGGVNPRTGDEVFDATITEHVLAVMATCGMYDSSGEWLVRVGLPAKSGVSGGLMAVSPSQFGIGLFSPPLDASGNSVRAVEASTTIAERFSLHLMHQVPRTAPSFARQERAENGGAEPDPVEPDTVVLEMNGDLEFASAELALLALQVRGDDPDDEGALVIDLSNVTKCHPVAARLFDAIVAEISSRGVVVVTVDERERRLVHAEAEFATLAEALTFCGATPAAGDTSAVRPPGRRPGHGG